MLRFALLATALLMAGCAKSKSEKTDDKKTGGGLKGALAGGQGDPFSRSLNTAQRMQAINDLKQIGLAMHNYHERNRSFPPAGKGLSWRVHLLPYLEHKPLYDQFRLNESWDSEHNRKLIANMPRVFNTPGTANDGKTAFHVFVGPGAPFGGSKPPGLRDIVDGSSNTILAVFSGPETEWTKPGGLEFNPSNPTAGMTTTPGRGLTVLFFDGSARPLPANFDPKKLSLLIQHADGQPPPQF